MARFDVYAHPDAELRKQTPYLVDVQSSFLDSLETRIVIPLRSSKYISNPLRDLNPIFEIAGGNVVLDTAAMAAFPTALLKRPATDLARHAAAVTGAIDTLLGSH
jgi:toxin CcdB